MPFGEKQEHESYGMIGISHVQCGGGVSLFGSSIKHDRVIRLRIKRANVERDLHREWYHGNESVVEIDLSASQFAQFITTPNVGDGIPCTLRYVEGVEMDKPPYRGQNEMFNRELQKDFLDAMSGADELLKESRDMLDSKGAMKVADKKKLLGKLDSLIQHIKANMPFLHKQFTRSMDKTVTAAKAEIEDFYTSAIMKMGKRALEAGHKPDVPQIEE
jgi:hypothetical protein